MLTNIYYLSLHDALPIYYKLDNSLHFTKKIMHCIDIFKAPYKAILIQLYESACERNDEELKAEIKANFDIKLKQHELESLFKELSLDVSLVQPSNIIDLGELKSRVEEKHQLNEEVEMYREHQEFIEEFIIALEEAVDG